MRALASSSSIMTDTDSRHLSASVSAGSLYDELGGSGTIDFRVRLLYRQLLDASEAGMEFDDDRLAGEIVRLKGVMVEALREDGAFPEIERARRELAVPLAQLGWVMRDLGFSESLVDKTLAALGVSCA